jgi:hypothetical protein
MVERRIVCRHVEGIRRHAHHHVYGAVSNRTGRMCHADYARSAAVEPLKEEARFDPQMLRQRRNIVGWEQEAGCSEAIDRLPRKSGVRERCRARLVEEALDALGGFFGVERLASADNSHALEHARHVRSRLPFEAPRTRAR